MYNTGCLDAGASCVNKVLAAAGIRDGYGLERVDVVRDANIHRYSSRLAYRIS